MTQYETIRECRRLLKLNGGLTAPQLALVMRTTAKKVIPALRVMGDCYVDRWAIVGGKEVAVYDLVDRPQNCPRPNRTL